MYRPGIGHLLFSYRPFMTATVINRARDRDRRAARSATGRGNDPSIPESLWGRARGCFGGPVGLRNGTRQRGGQESTRGILETGTASTKDQHVADFGRGFAARREGGLL